MKDDEKKRAMMSGVAESSGTNKVAARTYAALSVLFVVAAAALLPSYRSTFDNVFFNCLKPL